MINTLFHNQSCTDPALIPVPEVRICFKFLISWNDVAQGNQAWQKTADKNLWFDRGRTKINKFADDAGLESEDYREERPYKYKGKDKVKVEEGRRLKTTYFVEPVMCIVRVWKPDNTRNDIHNLYLKAVLDGFKAARLFKDDDVKCIPKVYLSYEGVDKTLVMSRAEAKARRERLKDRQRLPAAFRVWFDFWKLSTLREYENDPRKIMQIFSLTGLTDG